MPFNCSPHASQTPLAAPSPRERWNSILGRVEIACLARDILADHPDDEQLLADLRVTYDAACHDLIEDMEELAKIGLLDEFRRYLAVTMGRV